jgi:hypothetical protein
MSCHNMFCELSLQSCHAMTCAVSYHYDHVIKIKIQPAPQQHMCHVTTEDSLNLDFLQQKILIFFI